VNRAEKYEAHCTLDLNQQREIRMAMKKRKAKKKKSPAKRKSAAKKKRKAPGKKKAVKRPSKKKAAAPAAAPIQRSTGPITKKLTKSGILNELSQNTGWARKQVATMLDELENLIGRHIRKGGIGEFTLPGLLKVRAVQRPATPQRMGRNPATGEEIVIPAKPASVRVRVSALKRLKGMV
jgi:nucleoid DNA-binding protein